MGHSHRDKHIVKSRKCAGKPVENCRFVAAATNIYWGTAFRPLANQSVVPRFLLNVITERERNSLRYFAKDTKIHSVAYADSAKSPYRY